MDHFKREKLKVHPRDRNNFLSNTFFIYALKLFGKGFKKDLEENDLYEVVRGYESKELGNELEVEWEKQKQNNKSLSIIRLLLKCYGIYYVKLGFLQLFIDVVYIVIPPYALGKIIAYFTPGQTAITKQGAWYYAAVFIGIIFFQCVYIHNYILYLAMFGIKVRTAFSSFMYRKVLKLDPTHLGNISVGKIVTLITKDVNTFEAFIDFGNDLWIGFIKTFVVAFILYSRLGISALVGVGTFFVIMPLQIYLGQKVTAMKLNMCKATDDRLQSTQESLSAIRIIKMYTWEKIFDNKIAQHRKKEIKLTYKMFILRYLILAIGSLSSQIAFFLMMISYIWLDNVVTAEIVYFISSTFVSLSYGLAELFPLGIYQTAELQSAIKRMGQILKAAELEENKENVLCKTILPEIQMKNVTVSIQDNPILKKVTLSMEKGLMVITGPVGSGKSFLLKTILQDYKPDKGFLMVEGSISYASQEPWLFPSSIRQNILFNQNYNEKRYYEVLKVCALIYDFELLEAGDSTIVEDRGINLSKGQQARINLARAIYKERDIYLLDDSLAALDANVSSFIYKECILKFLKGKMVVFVSHNVDFAKLADVTVVMENGEIKQVGKNLELGNYEIVEENDSQTNKNSETENVVTEDEYTKLITETRTKRKVYQEEKKTGEVAKSIYRKYIQMGGGFMVLIFVLIVFLLTQITTTYNDNLVSVWVNLEESISNQTTSNSSNSSVLDNMYKERTFIFYIYSVMTVTSAAMTLARCVALFFFTRAAAVNLHKKMISTILTAKMKFFDSNFIGNILNRFSKDLVTVDDNIAFTIYHVFSTFLVIAGSVFLIASVNVTFLIPTAFFLLSLLIVRKLCLRTSRNLKRLDASTKSPVIGHLNATVEGLTTIRAFKAQDILKHEFDRHQDLYTSASYVFMCSMRAFAFIMDFLCGFYIACIVLRFLMIDNDESAGQVGLAISQAYSLTGTLQWGLRQWAEIENQMTSVERVLEYTNINTENKQGLTIENWPNKGEVKYENVYLSYTNSDRHVLKNLNFVVKSKEKIGIVGRTGAGKSSIISTLFRMYDVEGKIIIDGVDIKTVGLDYLRSNISIIPQDPVLFTGNIRDNIDPTQTYTDEEIWRAIEVSHLTALIPNLEFKIVDSGANFSVGQRQLICLARAIIQNNKIIVLDEATANMDAETDDLIRTTIEENFRDCTVFTIAHKLQSILKSDKIMVMEKGEIIEYDQPKNLLNNSNGLFYKMIDKAGLLKSSL